MRAGDELRPAAVRTETPLPRPAPWRIPQQQRQRRYYAETELRSQAGHRDRKRYRCGHFKLQPTSLLLPEPSTPDNTKDYEVHHQEHAFTSLTIFTQ
ncbi:Hypothetical protein SMAX5B_001986 [Scophthalmus maximus]|uniref:Uncharacterized protein n=1 Tax=Scophthalmus maximus TaxID=52904 RepID=A0A2U9CXU0_SCOMX|nr:Hypothetical protein SMAX5B_001986 [Scophthalmus maximus]